MSLEGSSDNEMNEWELNVLKSGMLGEKKKEEIIDFENVQMKQNVNNWDDIIAFFEKRIKKCEEAMRSSSKNIQSCVEQISRSQVHLNKLETKQKQINSLLDSLKNLKNVVHDVKISSDVKMEQLAEIERKLNVL